MCPLKCKAVPILLPKVAACSSSSSSSLSPVQLRLQSAADGRSCAGREDGELGSGLLILHPLSTNILGISGAEGGQLRHGVTSSPLARTRVLPESCN